MLGDVIGSTELADRAGFRQRLQNVLSEINEEHGERIHAPFGYIKGVDEIGGVLDSVAPIAEIQRDIARVVHPSQIRIVAVVGEIDVNPESEVVTRMDGPAFANADETLSAIEREDLTFRLRGKEPTLDILISDEINLLDMYRAERTERQMEVILKYEQLGTQKKVAQSLGITPQGVSEHLRESNWKQVRAIERRLIEIMKSYPDVGTGGPDGE